MGERRGVSTHVSSWRHWTKLSAVALLTGTLLSCVGPPWNWWPLSVVVWVPAFLALRGARTTDWFFVGLVAGCVLGGNVCLGLAGRNLAGGVAVQLGLGLLLSTWFLFTGLVANASPSRVEPWAPALTWPVWAAACEMFGFSLTPTIGLVAAQPQVVGVVSWVGGVGLDTLVVVINVGVVLLSRAGQRRTGAAAILLCIGVFTCGVGFRPRAADGPTIEVRVLQPDLSASAYASTIWSPWTRDRIERDLDEMTAKAIASGGELVIWPENGNSLSNAQLVRRRERLAELIGDSDAELLVVGPEFRERGMGVMAFSMDRSGIRSVTRKQHLVPFEEQDVVAGRSEVLDGRHGVWGVAICFEAMFSTLMGEHARSGAQLLVVTGDNATFIHSSITEWHQAYSLRHALEAGIPLVFASNRGPSRVWSGYGELRAESPAERRAILSATVRLGMGPSVAAQGGRYLFPLLGLLLLAAGLAAKRTPKPRAARRVPWFGFPLMIGISAGVGVLLHVAGVASLRGREPLREARQLRIGSGAIDGLGPLYRQSRESSCGQAALAFALHTLGDQVLEGDILDELPHDPEGTSLASLERVAHAHGFETRAVRVSAEALQIGSGVALLHVLENHFLVVFRIDEDMLWVFDPSAGVITQVERDQLNAVWEGVALMIQPPPTVF